MTEQPSSDPGPSLPPGVRAFAIVFIWIAGCLVHSTLESLPGLSKQGAIVIPALFQEFTLFFLLIYLAIGYLKGERWAWWFTYTNATLALFLLPIIILSLSQSQEPISVFLVMLSYWLIALLTYLGLRTSSVRTHFRILDINLTRCCVMLVLLTSLQSAWWFAPEFLINIYTKLNSFN